LAEFSHFLWSLFDLGGSASRKRGWIVFGVFLAAMIMAQVLRSYPEPLASLGFLGVGVTFVLLIVATVQRLHDAGRSGYWIFSTLVPFAGLIATIAILSMPKRDVPRAGHPFAKRIGAVALVVVMLLFVTRAIYWQPYWIPSEAMKPTLLVGDFIIATQVKPDDLQRGDVVVFRHPVKGSDFIKRLIGMPGDKIQMKDGILYINGEAATRVPDGVFEEVYEPQGPMRSMPRCENVVVGAGEICKKSRFVETLPGGRQIQVLKIDTIGPVDDTDVFTVPLGQYFFMGDNRDNSFDSRFAQSVGGVGFVPAGNIKSRARWVLFSSAGSMIADVTSWRRDRYLLAIQ
jgi:signal peptidase I